MFDYLCRVRLECLFGNEIRLIWITAVAEKDIDGRIAQPVFPSTVFIGILHLYSA